jgi:uncharacterized protein (DUF362 family)
MSSPRVAIVRGEEPSKMVKRALELIGAKDLVKPEDRVLIKPNYVAAKHPSTGVTTDSRVVEGIIEFVKRFKVNDLVVGEGGAGDTDKAFDVVGIRDVVERQKVRLVNLNQDSRIKVKIPVPLALKDVGIAETGLHSTCIINVPKLKVHHIAVVTLCMKNLMGLILPKNIMHSQINKKIADLASFFKDKVRINLIDGLVGAELDETSGNPVEMDLIVAGRDMVAVDAVATSVMGIDPSEVQYLRLAQEKGVGVSNLGKIEILGEEIEEVKKEFRI